MERPPLRAGAAGVTRPSGQQATQEISFLSAGKGERRDPHPGLGVNAGQQSSPASFGRKDSTGHLGLGGRRARKSYRAQLCVYEGQGLHLLHHQGCRGGALFPTSFQFRGQMYRFRAAYKLVPKFTLLLSRLQHRALAAGLGTNLPCPAPSVL